MNPASEFNPERLLEILRTLPSSSTYIVGFSGGADSTALLHAIAGIRDRLHAPVRAVHVNHGLHERADVWQAWCEEFCRALQIPLDCITVKLGDTSGQGVEAEARQQRYRAFESFVQPGDSLLTAHHADDQAETLLLNLLRGSGVEGLSAMPPNRTLGKGNLQRPLLSCGTASLKDYLRDNGVEWLEDPSNTLLNHDRNFLRHAVIPTLEKRWPGINKRLSLTRNAMADARDLLQRTAERKLSRQLLHPRVLMVSADLIGDAALFRLVLRRWLRNAGAASIPATTLNVLLAQLNAATGRGQVSVQWGDWCLRHYRDSLWLQSASGFQPCSIAQWRHAGSALELGRDAGRIVLTGDDPVLPTGHFLVSGRAACMHPSIDVGHLHRSLKYVFQKGAIPPWLRDCIPLCSLDDRLVAIGDWCFDKHFENWLTQRKLSLEWQPAHPLLKYIRARQRNAAVDPSGGVR